MLATKKEIHRYSKYPFDKVSKVFMQTRKIVENLKGEYDDIFIINHQGGSSSGKTYSILQSIIWDLYCYPNSKCTVVGETIPALRKGAITDFHTIWKSEQFFQDFIKDFNRTNLFATMSNGSTIEFVSYENAESAKHGKREFLFCNEISGIKESIVNQLTMRTKIRCYFDYNSNKSFWVHENIKPRNDVVTIYSNFTHNRFCPDQTKKSLLRLKGRKNPNDWLVFGMGKTGKPTNTKAFFTEFDEQKHVVDDIRINPDLPLLLSFDFNFNPVSCVLMQLDFSEGLYVIKEFQQDGGTQRLLEKHLGWLKDSNYALQITGDNSGNSRHSSSETSDFQIIENFFGMRVSEVTKKANLKHILSRAICNKALYQIPVYISKEGCPTLIEEILFAEETIDGRLKKDDKEFRMDLVDAWRYGMNFYFRDTNMVDEVEGEIERYKERNSALVQQYEAEQERTLKRSPMRFKVNKKNNEDGNNE